MKDPLYTDEERTLTHISEILTENDLSEHECIKEIYYVLGGSDLATSWKNSTLENYLLHSAECFEGGDLHDFLNAVVRTASKLNALKLEQAINKAKNSEKGLDTKVFAKNIKYLRKAKGLTQQALATKLGCSSKVTVMTWEKGIGYPAIERLIMLSEIFDISVDDLLKIDIDNAGTVSGTPIPEDTIKPKKSSKGWWIRQAETTLRKGMDEDVKEMQKIIQKGRKKANESVK